MIVKFLNKFEHSGGKYVSWKNNHELIKVLDGDSDLDIFVPIQYKPLFFELIKEQHWIQVVNPVANYPEVSHFYVINEDLIAFHLHVYFKVITGESWLKEYKFPLDDFLIGNTIRHSSGIQILNQKAQSFLFVLRHFIKGSSFFSRWLYKKELASYRQEWDLCKGEFDPRTKVDLIDFTDYLEKAGLKEDLNLPSISVSRAVRKELRDFLRFSESRLVFLRLKSFRERLFNKLFYKRKKIFPSQGFVLAFSGADGVGKSTMSETIGSAYAKFLTIKNIQLGKPQSAWVEAVRGLLNKQDKKTSYKSLDIINIENKNITIKKALSAVFLAYLRYIKAKRAKKYKKKGYLVISDRWPTVESYKMDGPKLGSKNLTGIFKTLSKIEKKYYDKLAFADLCVILTVPIEVAIKRNRDRVKEGKESDDEIIERHLQNASHFPKSKEIIKFDNNGSIKEKRYLLITLIQNKLFREE